MTTEIAVINRLGVVLATDSAVTISGGGASKVFDTGDKLFELNEAESIGVMVNGNMDMLGVPWEVIIKDFRSTTHTKPPLSMRDWIQSLLDFISIHKALSPEAEKAFVESVAAEEFARIKRDVSRIMLRSPTDASVTIIDRIVSAAEDRRKQYNESDMAESLKGISREAVRKLHIRTINRLITSQFRPIEIPNAKRVVLRRLVVDRLFSQLQSDWTTGLIVAGYGGGDIFPSIAMADVEGSVGGQVKYNHVDHVVIDRNENPGRIISFAQTDVIDRILSGVDSRFISKSKGYIETAIGKARDEVVKLLKSAGVTDDIATGIFEDISTSIADGYLEEFAESAREDFQGDFNEMVALMPKQDIIELAEALVSITAVERKASSEQATVGGPIDVAFITKHEGFVWIKRKHYFDKDLNPRYFWRKQRDLQACFTQTGTARAEGTQT